MLLFSDYVLLFVMLAKYEMGLSPVHHCAAKVLDDARFYRIYNLKISLP
jgi:hypothetical protein